MLSILHPFGRRMEDPVTRRSEMDLVRYVQSRSDILADPEKELPSGLYTYHLSKWHAVIARDVEGVLAVVWLLVLLKGPPVDHCFRYAARYFSFVRQS